MSSRRRNTARGDGQGPALVPDSSRIGIGVIVVGSIGAGLVAALLLPFVPADTVDENFATGMVLVGFALGWVLMAGLSMWLTDQPQRWALVPAAFMALSGVIVLLAPDAFVEALDWVWPPALLVLVVWVFIRARRDLHSRTRRWVLNPVLVVLVLFALGGAYEVVGRSVGPTIAMRGQLVDVGPYRLHLECTGSGAPTVILEPGAGGSAASLGLIAPEVSRDTRVCVYDRAGRGWSDAAGTPPDAAQIATDLHALLDRAHVPGPYVMAGHSFGGLYVMTFAAQYPDQIAGLVLVDSTAPNSTPVPAQQEGSYSVVKHVSALVSTTARLGVGRLIAQTGFSDLPSQYRADARASAATAKEMASFIDEYAVANRSGSEAGELVDLDAKPLIVLTAEHGNLEGWMADQDQLATLSTDSQHHVVPGSTHASFVENPAHAAAVTQAIHDVVESVRTATPLPSS